MLILAKHKNKNIMKKIILLLLLSVGSIAFSQTTADEYKYMTKGYAVALSSGLDLKKGYTVTEVYKTEYSSYSFSFRSLVRESDNTLAGIIIVARSSSWGNTYYLGLPFGDALLYGYYRNDVLAWDASMTDAYALASSEFFANAYSAYFDSLKTPKLTAKK